MKILIIGSGGREHALVRQVSLSQRASKIYCAPGNAGMRDICELVPLPARNVDMLADFAKKNGIDLTLVGPEEPLAMGIVDRFREAHLQIFGPDKEASLIECSKIFTKQFCERHGIPTAPFRSFEDSAEARKFIREKDTFPVVVKADGLAAGKGVIIAYDRAAAEKAVQDMMLYEKLGQAGRRIVIEDFLKGEEASFIGVTDGETFVEFPPAQDHKPLFDGDKGPNTGGMGAYAPAPIVDKTLRQKILERIIQPTLRGLAREGRPYTGFLYAGLMISDGEPALLEYNCRLGDPEAQVLLPLLKSDFLELVEHAVAGSLKSYTPRFERKSAVSVVLASSGYPGEYRRGDPIAGLDGITDPDVLVFHAGTKRGDGGFVTHGGRVLTVTAKAADLKKAIQKAYENVKRISWDGMHYRSDIGQKGLKGCE